MLILGILTLLPFNNFAESSSVDFYYFNPDSPQSNLNLLKQEMDRFLGRSGSEHHISFQPFAHLLDFDNSLKAKPPTYIFLPEWYVAKYGEQLNLRPILTPLRSGKSFYHKVLLAPIHADINEKDIAISSLAMTSMGPDTGKILQSILFQNQNPDVLDYIVVNVPKDSDALFALVLGQVDFALVTKDNLELMWKINPNLKKSVKIIKESASIPMPVLCYMEQQGGKNLVLNDFTKAFTAKNASNDRKIIMEMLKIDGWQISTD